MTKMTKNCRKLLSTIMHSIALNNCIHVFVFVGLYSRIFFRCYKTEIAFIWIYIGLVIIHNFNATINCQSKTDL